MRAGAIFHQAKGTHPGCSAHEILWHAVKYRLERVITELTLGVIECSVNIFGQYIAEMSIHAVTHVQALLGPSPATLEDM